MSTLRRAAEGAARSGPRLRERDRARWKASEGFIRAECHI